MPKGAPSRGMPSFSLALHISCHYFAYFIYVHEPASLVVTYLPINLFIHLDRPMGYQDEIEVRT